MKILPKCDPAIFGVAVAGLLFVSGASAGDVQMMDTNKDGMISIAEHAAGARQMFQRMDADGDSRVTATEMDASRQQMSGGIDAGNMSPAEKIKAIDVDQDGVISAAEHEAGSRAMFSKMDLNRDGKLTSAEMQAGHQKLMGEQPH